MIPAVEEANAISEELDKKVKFEIVVISAKARGLQTGRTEVSGCELLHKYLLKIHLSFLGCL